MNWAGAVLVGLLALACVAAVSLFVVGIIHFVNLIS